MVVGASGGDGGWGANGTAGRVGAADYPPMSHVVARLTRLSTDARLLQQANGHGRV
jgi:hypothetical protein